MCVLAATANTKRYYMYILYKKKIRIIFPISRPPVSAANVSVTLPRIAVIEREYVTIVI